MKFDIHVNITTAHVQLFTGIDEASFEKLYTSGMDVLQNAAAFM